MMKHNSIYTRLAGMVVAALAIVGCTDTWNDHYEGISADVHEGTLWQAITSNSQLSNFATVLQATGYDKMLNGSQTFTVFAPTNSALSQERVNELITLYQQDTLRKVKDRDNRAIKEFVQNHIALYNYSVATTGRDSVVMMNGKYLQLTPSSLSNSSLLSTNYLTENGVLFTLSDQVGYAYNIMEYLMASDRLDSVGNFLNTYNRYEFYPSLSVPGGIEDGKTWYLDSVTYLENRIFSYYDEASRQAGIGLINSEDSTYRMVVPTNEVWNSLVSEYSAYFNYDKEVLKRDSIAWAETRMAILRGTTFSRTRNAVQRGNDWVWNTDSALSVNAANYNFREVYWGRYGLKYYQYDQPYASGGVWADTEEVPCSNGVILIADSWNIDKKQTFFRESFIEGENRNYFEGIDETSTNEPVYRSVETSNPFYNNVSGHRFALISPTGQSAAEVRYKFPDVLSNIPYDIYAVFVPARAQDTLATDTIPCKFNASISYHRPDGVQSADYYLPENDSTLTGSQRYNFETDPTKVDTVLIARNIVVPTSSYGLADAQVMIRLRTSLRAADRNNKTHTANMRIDCLYMKPHEE